MIYGAIEPTITLYVGVDIRSKTLTCQESGDPPRFELSAKPSKADKEAKGQSGFVPVAARWVIERSNAWVERCKSLVKNFDRRLDRSNAELELGVLFG